MSRSRSYQRSRHYDFESNKRPIQRVADVLATFDNDESDDEASAWDPVIVETNGRLRYWLSPRTPLDLHRNQREIRHLLETDIEFWYYHSTPEPIYARA